MVRLTITALELVNHGPFRGPHRFELPGEGLCVCTRPNEFGKTTLLGAVLAVFWGETTTSKHWSSQAQEPHRGAVEFTRSQPEGVQRFRVERDFQTHQVIAWSLDAEGGRRQVFAGMHNPAGRTPDHQVWLNDVLPGLWTPMTAAAMRHLAMVTQPMPDPKDLDTALVQQLVSGSGSGSGTVVDAKETLAAKYRKISKLTRDAGLSTQNARKDGELDELRARRDALQAELTQATAELERVEALRERIGQLDARQQTLRQDGQAAESALAVIERFRDLNKELDRAKEQAGQLEAATQQTRDADKEIRAAETSIAAMPEPLRELDPGAAEPLRQALHDYQLRRRDLKDLELYARRRADLREEYAPVWDWPEDAAERLRPLQEAAEQGAVARREVEELQRRLDLVRPRLDAWRRAKVAAAAALAVALVGALSIVLATGSLAWGILVGLLAAVASAATVCAAYGPQKVDPDYPQVASRLADATARLSRIEQEIAAARVAADWTAEADLMRLVQMAERRRVLRQSLEAVDEEEGQQRLLWAELDPAKLPDPLPALLADCQQNVEASLRAIDEFQAAVVQRKTARERLASVLSTVGCQDSRELEARCQEWQDRRVGIRRDLDRLTRENALAEELVGMAGEEVERRRQELEQRRDDAGREMDSIEEQSRGLQRELLAAEAGVRVNVAEGEVQLAQIDAHIERLGRRCEAIRHAYVLLDEAARRYSAHHREAIEQRVNDLMRTWTGAIDRRFSVAADFGLGLTVQTDDGREETTALSTLSQGARDQLAMAVRMAVLDRVATDVVLPILIDDAFLTWDAQRRARLAGALHSAAGRRQLVLVSHDPAFESWGQPAAETPAAPSGPPDTGVVDAAS